MATVLPFAGMRPPASLAAQVAAPPYDVLTSAQARALAGDNPLSFLHISKPEIDLDPQADPYGEEVYRMGQDNFQRFVSRGTLIQDMEPTYYGYRQTLEGHSQTGLVALVSVDEYEQDSIRKHELTRPDKENDRVRHMQALQAQTGPVFLTYRDNDQLSAQLEQTCAGIPDVDFTSDGVRHQLWVMRDHELVVRIRDAFIRVPALYVADGHHRSAAATRYREFCRGQNPAHRGDEAYNYFLAVLFPHAQLNIQGYHRVVRDLGQYDRAGFLAALAQDFAIQQNATPAMPAQPGEFGLYLPDQWYRLTFKHEKPADPVASQDVALLQDRVLGPLLGIDNPRTDKRIDFIGGIHGHQGLENAVDKEGFAAAFACYPVTIDALMAVADQGMLMPPKSTWFEPKLKSGLVVHYLG
jgi:uncharacterized protein (DUF1015 family)